MPLLTVRPRWLLYLMIFFIGWSRVFAVIVEPVPMHHVISMPVSAGVVGAAAQPAMHHHQSHPADCSDIKMPHVSADHSDKTKCHQEGGGSIQHGYCNDCSLSHCQSLNLWLIQPAFDGIADVTEQRSSSYPLPVQARHLSGYWQKILRPPRA